MIKIQVLGFKVLATVLTGIAITTIDVLPGELDLLLWQAVKHGENDDFGNAKALSDGSDDRTLGSRRG